MKKLLSLLFLALFTVTLAACNLNTTQASGKTYMVVDINPSIEFILDAEGNVESYNLLNEDAEIVYASIVEADVTLLGLSAEAALEIWLEAALELGYIDVTREDNVIIVTVVGEDEDEEVKNRERMREHAENFLFRHRIGGIVVENGLTIEEFLIMAQEYGVSPGRLRLALSAVAEKNDLTIEEALQLSVRELMDIIHPAHRARIEAFINSQMEARLEMARAMREEARQRNEEHANQSEGMSRAQIEARIRIRVGEAVEAEAHADYQARIEARKQQILEDQDQEDTEE